MRYDDVIIDAGNEEHVTRHGVTAEEIEQVFRNDPRINVNRKGRAADYIATGKTDAGSPVRIAFDSFAPGAVRPVAAWRI